MEILGRVYSVRGTLTSCEHDRTNKYKTTKQINIKCIHVCVHTLIHAYMYTHTHTNQRGRGRIRESAARRASWCSRICCSSCARLPPCPPFNPPESFNDVHDVGTRGACRVNRCRYLAVAAAPPPLRVPAPSGLKAPPHAPSAVTAEYGPLTGCAHANKVLLELNVTTTRATYGHAWRSRCAAGALSLRHPLPGMAAYGLRFSD